MSRQEQDTDFLVEVPGIGTFKFGRRTQQDKYQIRCVYGVLTKQNYNEDGTPADFEAMCHATIEVLAVELPKGFSLENLDPFDEAVPNRLSQVYIALREKEVSFRKKDAEGGEAKST